MEELKLKIKVKKQELFELELQLKNLENSEKNKNVTENKSQDVLTNEEIMRYSRQLILPQISVEGQLALKNAKVLVVGCGGLGCPVAIYLSAAGVGTIGLVDYDTVEVTNLHRQVAHDTEKLGQNKCQSLASACKRLNPHTNFHQHHVLLDSCNALDIIKLYDIVVDATDNVPTRYLLNDACVLLGRKPLVSGSALKFDGQLTVYIGAESPCYRCIHPSPPPPNTVNNCSDGGVLGSVVGTIGCLQASEVIKLITKIKPSYGGKLLMYDGLEGVFRTFNLRGKQASCAVCGTHPTITCLQDYPQFCSSTATDKDTPLNLLHRSDRITAKEYKQMLDQGEEHVLVDVREPTELKICTLPHPSLNVRMNDLRKEQTIQKLKRHLAEEKIDKVVVVCRRGNNSQKAVQCFKQNLHDFDFNQFNNNNINNNNNNESTTGNNNSNNNCNNINNENTGIGGKKLQIFDIVGGLYEWKRQVDDNLAIY